MLVTLNILLEGGHRHACICDDADPTIIALVTALSGANPIDQAGHAGLIQVDLAHSGQRLFVKSTSIIGIEMTPYLSKAQQAQASIGPVVQNCGFPDGAYASAPCVVQPVTISEDACRAVCKTLAGTDLPDVTTPDSSMAIVLEQMADAIRKTRTYLGVPDFLKTTPKYSVFRADKGYSWPSGDTPTNAEDVLNRPLAAVAVILPSDARPLELTLYDNAIDRRIWGQGQYGRTFDLGSGTAAIFQGHAYFEIARGDKGFILVTELVVENDEE